MLQATCKRENKPSWASAWYNHLSSGLRLPRSIPKPHARCGHPSVQPPAACHWPVGRGGWAASWARRLPLLLTPRAGPGRAGQRGPPIKAPTAPSLPQRAPGAPRAPTFALSPAHSGRARAQCLNPAPLPLPPSRPAAAARHHRSAPGPGRGWGGPRPWTSRAWRWAAPPGRARHGSALLCSSWALRPLAEGPASCGAPGGWGGSCRVEAGGGLVSGV